MHRDASLFAMSERDFFLRYQNVTSPEIRSCLAAYADLTREIQRGVPTLVRMRRFMKDLHHPEKRLKAVHVAGTSGKGSTATLMARVLAEHSFCVGLTTSPHLRDLTERIQVNNALIPVDELTRLLRRCFEILARWPARAHELPHYFELMTALAFLWFVEQKVEYTVIETGLGGRFDATNALRAKNKVAVFTPIDLDHQRLLGNTRAKIALEKSGMMVPGGMAWSAPQPDEVKKVLDEQANHQDVTLSYTQAVDPRTVRMTKKGTQFSYQNEKVQWRDLEMSVVGLHQAQNATLILDVVQAIAQRDGWTVSESSTRQALKETVLPGRFEIRSLGEQTIILDVAHNPQKIRSLLETVRVLFPKISIELILGLSSLDHAEAIVNIVKEYEARIFSTDIEVGDLYQRYRLADVQKLQEVIERAGILL